MITTRRTMLKTCSSATAVLVALMTRTAKSSPQQKAQVSTPIPVIHITDLYHPPQDPDDQIDLATILALEEFDLRGVVLDVTQLFLQGAPDGFDIPRDPGYIPLIQISFLLGRDIPVTTGPIQALAHPDDTAEDRPHHEQAGILMLLDTLANSSEPVVITVVGSARVVTAAFNRNPELMRDKTRAVVVNAGSTGGHKTEWNVGLDLHAYVGLWKSGLPIYWYPCGTEKSAFVREHERGTYWRTTNKTLFDGLPDKLQAWFAYGFSGSARGDFIQALNEPGHGAAWKEILAENRNMWSTASLVNTAGRVLALSADGWRFLPKEAAKDDTVWPWRMDPISASASTDGKVTWRLHNTAESTWLFGRKPDVEYGEAMSEALNALLKTIPV